MGQGNAKHKHRMIRVWIENRPEEKEVIFDKKLNMIWQCAFSAQKANCTLECIKRRVAMRKRHMFLPLYFPFQGHKDDQSGPEHVSYEDRLRELGLFSLKKTLRRLYCSLPSPTRKMDREFFQVHVVRTRDTHQTPIISAVEGVRPEDARTDGHAFKAPVRKKENHVYEKLHDQISVSEKKILKVSVQKGMIYKTMVFFKIFATEFGTSKHNKEEFSALFDRTGREDEKQLTQIMKSDIGSGIKCTLITFRGDNNLSGVDDTPEAQDHIKRDLDNKLDKWSSVSLAEQTQDSPDDKDLGELVGERLDTTQKFALTTQKFALTAQKAKSVLGYIQSRVANRATEGILPLDPSLVTHHLEYCIQLEHKEDVDLLEWFQRGPQKLSKGWSTSAMRKG
ncbi:hypothetical protein DUI87_16337 [Hirundo rustica rustica]|uniref:Uncharacterized protein n=1 Tax=Hirundo rustica rustica TaxID=333673 RepID=A0A3M0KI77_HIRRU|nr:hypothetical protein DUI87_16337 [Hirundo rustica rustica]